MAEKICGIYKIQSIIKPDRFYIGSSKDIQRRFRGHKRNLINKTHHSHKLQRHYNKYGKEDLVFSVIDEFVFISREHIIIKEQFYLDQMKPYFNESRFANSRAGVKASMETRKKQSRKSKGRKKSPEHRRKIGDANRGRKFDKKFGLKISMALKGKKRKPFTDEHIKNLSNSKKGDKNPNFGKDMTEQIQKLTALNTGRKQTKEQCRATSVRMTEYWATHPHRKHTEEERKRCGRPQSPERIAEIKEWWRLRKENGWISDKKAQFRERDENGRFKKKGKS